MKKIDLNNKTYERRGTDSVKWDHMDFLDNRATKSTLPLWLSCLLYTSDAADD